jgi:hypothetical protein
MKYVLFSTIIFIGIFMSGCLLEEFADVLYSDFTTSLHEVKQHNLEFSGSSEPEIKEQIINHCKQSCKSFEYEYNSYKYTKTFENNVYYYKDIICVCK